jgi:siroheme synthase (precorrin-2 oxidase/ferrochelatase)
MGIDADLYPVGLIVADRPCLVVGGGRVAARKISGLLSCGAIVKPTSPWASWPRTAPSRGSRGRP